jgi:hypothetical protein
VAHCVDLTTRGARPIGSSRARWFVQPLAHGSSKLSSDGAYGWRRKAMQGIQQRE